MAHGVADLGQACLWGPELFLRPTGWAFQEPGKNRQGLTSCTAGGVAGSAVWIRTAGKGWPGVTDQGPCPGQKGKRPLGLRFGLASLYKEEHPGEHLRTSMCQAEKRVGHVCLQGKGRGRWAAPCLSPAHEAGSLWVLGAPSAEETWALGGCTGRDASPLPGLFLGPDWA